MLEEKIKSLDGYFVHLYCKIFFQHFLLFSQKSKHKQWKLDVSKNLLTD